MRLGLYGGSFDPIHYGHLLLAETCREQCQLDEVWVIPAAQPPHKRSRQLAPAANRIEMLELAIAGHDNLRISQTEIDRGGVSYTVETLRAIHQEQPDAELFFLMGADSLYDFHSWREPEEICGLAVPVVVQRAGSPEPDLGVLEPFAQGTRMEQIRRHVVRMPVIELSSSEIRSRCHEGRSIRFQTPRAVERYIASHSLYADLNSGDTQ